jgi:geranylgeranyl pyrophosphate synthase
LNNSSSFSFLVQDEVLLVEALMRSQADGFHPDLGTALDMLLSSGGKRVRAVMALLIGRMLNTDKQKLITLAAAIELLHTATLVHDDLIDGALFRRGVPTLNSRWTPAATVLTGDFLFGCAAKLAAETESVPAINQFARTLTIIVNGEINQMFSGRGNLIHDDYYQRIYAKTASLFETTSYTTALISPVDAGVQSNLREYGRQVGIGFQMIDDILDFTGDEAKVGKPVGTDLRHGLLTLPALYYLEEYPDQALSIKLLNGEFLSEGQVDTFVVDVRNSKAIHRTYEEAKGHIENGLFRLRTMKPCQERNALEELATYLFERQI